MFLFSKRAAQFFFVQTVIGIFVDNIAEICAFRFCLLFLLFCRIAEYNQGGRNDIFRKSQDPSLYFVVFHNIADIAGSDSKGLCSGNRVLCGNQGIIRRNQKIARTRGPRTASGIAVGVKPFQTVGA